MVNNRRDWESIALSDRAVMIRDSAFAAESGTEFTSIFAKPKFSDSIGYWEKGKHQVTPQTIDFGNSVVFNWIDASQQVVL